MPEPVVTKIEDSEVTIIQEAPQQPEPTIIPTAIPAVTPAVAPLLQASLYQELLQGVDPSFWTIGKNPDSGRTVTGEAIYLETIPEFKNVDVFINLSPETHQALFHFIDSKGNSVRFECVKEDQQFQRANCTIEYWIGLDPQKGGGQEAIESFEGLYIRVRGNRFSFMRESDSTEFLGITVQDGLEENKRFGIITAHGNDTGLGGITVIEFQPIAAE